MSNEKLIKNWQRNSFKVARVNTPYDTGNLAMNALKTSRIKNGFRIWWDEKNAFYIKFVNDAPQNQGFVAKTAYDIKNVVKNRLKAEFVSRPNIRTLARREVRQQRSRDLWNFRKEDLKFTKFREERFIRGG